MVFAVASCDLLSHLSVYDLEYIVLRCISLTQPASDRMMALVGRTRDSYAEEDRMIRVSSSLYRGAILTAMLALAFVAGCKKKPAAATPPPPPPPPPAARPTVSLQASPTSVNKGDSSTLSW